VAAFERRDCRHDNRRPRPAPVPGSAFAGFRFPPAVIVVAVRWYLRFGLSYRDVEELLAERGIQVDHVTIYRWVLRFTPLLTDAARPWRHLVGDRWAGRRDLREGRRQWRYVYRAIDQFGQVIDVFVSTRRDAHAADRFFQQAIGSTRARPVEVTTDKAPVYPAVLEALLPAAWHRTDQYANNRLESDHGRLKSRLRPMRGLKQNRSAGSPSQDGHVTGDLEEQGLANAVPESPPCVPDYRNKQRTNWAGCGGTRSDLESFASSMWRVTLDHFMKGTPVRGRLHIVVAGAHHSRRGDPRRRAMTGA